SEPVTYICNRTTQTLRRFHRHLISPVAPIVETDPQLTNAGSLSGLVATGVTACAFTCGAGATPCQRSLALKLTLTRGTAPNTESIQVFREVGLDNTP
ncbi:MAG TPA: hypothetical protein VFS24_17085, partial [Steroidobacteraceae bacterium]|nr:hypothetical protein [Steroidobacteraceae bacterium]